MSREFVKFMFF